MSSSQEGWPVLVGLDHRRLHFKSRTGSGGRAGPPAAREPKPGPQAPCGQALLLPPSRPSPVTPGRRDAGQSRLHAPPSPLRPECGRARVPRADSAAVFRTQALAGADGARSVPARRRTPPSGRVTQSPRVLSGRPRAQNLGAMGCTCQAPPDRTCSCQEAGPEPSLRGPAQCPEEGSRRPAHFRIMKPRPLPSGDPRWLRVGGAGSAHPPLPAVLCACLSVRPSVHPSVHPSPGLYCARRGRGRAGRAGRPPARQAAPCSRLGLGFPRPLRPGTVGAGAGRCRGHDAPPGPRLVGLPGWPFLGVTPPQLALLLPRVGGRAHRATAGNGADRSFSGVLWQ